MQNACSIIPLHQLGRNFKEKKVITFNLAKKIHLYEDFLLLVAGTRILFLGFYGKERARVGQNINRTT